MTERITLYADEGMILTDGEIFGRIITLAINENPDKFYEITEQQYEEIMIEKERKEKEEQERSGY